MAIIYRSAQKEDCPVIAEYIEAASDGLLDVLFQDNAAGMSVSEILRNGLAAERYDSYKSVVVAEYDSEVIGIIQCYSSMYHAIDREMRSFFSQKKLTMFEEFYASRIDNSLLINAMYVKEGFRRKGVGTKLLSLAKEEARLQGCQELSLFVEADNNIAISVYTACGFSLAKEITITGSTFARTVLLMRCALD